MEWRDVSAEDLVEALRDIDWSVPPRPPHEFFSNFSFPRSFSRWNSRVECNLSYYRANYLILVVFILGIGFLRRPLSIFATSFTALSIALLNDSFAARFNEKVTRITGHYVPLLAAKIGNPYRHVTSGQPSAKKVYICGQPRCVSVVALFTVSVLVWIVSSGLLSILVALLIGLLATLAHASFKIPKLNARMQAFREEVRAAWHKID